MWWRYQLWDGSGEVKLSWPFYLVSAGLLCESPWGYNPLWKLETSSNMYTRVWSVGREQSTVSFVGRIRQLLVLCVPVEGLKKPTKIMVRKSCFTGIRTTYSRLTEIHECFLCFKQLLLHHEETWSCIVFRFFLFTSLPPRLNRASVIFPYPLQKLQD